MIVDEDTEGSTFSLKIAVVHLFDLQHSPELSDVQTQNMKVFLLHSCLPVILPFLTNRK